MGARVRVAALASNSAGSASAASSQIGPVAPSAAQIQAAILRTLVPRGLAARIGRLLKVRGYLTTFKALTAGTVRLSWYFLPPGARLASGKPKPVLIATGKRTFTGARSGKVKIKLTAAGKRLLQGSSG